MESWEQDKQIKIQGVQPGPVKLEAMSAKQVWKSCKANDIRACAIVDFIPEKQFKDVPEPVLRLLHQYTDIFSEPKVLPPNRVYDHAIPLQPDAVPINSHPYKYSPQHKSEIER